MEGVKERDEVEEEEAQARVQQHCPSCIIVFIITCMSIVVT